MDGWMDIFQLCKGKDISRCFDRQFLFFSLFSFLQGESGKDDLLPPVR